MSSVSRRIARNRKFGPPSVQEAARRELNAMYELKLKRRLLADESAVRAAYDEVVRRLEQRYG